MATLDYSRIVAIVAMIDSRMVPKSGSPLAVSFRDIVAIVGIVTFIVAIVAIVAPVRFSKTLWQ